MAISVLRQTLLYLLIHSANLAKKDINNIKIQIKENYNFLYVLSFYYREQTWQWLLSPSPTCVKNLLTSPSPSWAWASASCIANPMPPAMASSPFWTPWLPTSGSTSSWPTWVLAVSFLLLPGKCKSFLLFYLSVLHTFLHETLQQT